MYIHIHTHCIYTGLPCPKQTNRCDTGLVALGDSGYIYIYIYILLYILYHNLLNISMKGGQKSKNIFPLILSVVNSQ